MDDATTRRAGRSRPRRGAVRLLALALLLTGCTALDDLRVEPGEGAVPLAEPSIPPAEARTLLAELRVQPRGPVTPAYRRDAFGDRWADIDGNGCNQRDDVLLRDGVPGTVTVQQHGRCPHDVLAGTWVDPYTGAELTFTDLKDQQQAQALQIDHVVPLAEAWRSGAAGWTDGRRERFANTLGVLLAADGPTNMSKGDDDPAAWRPRKAYQCEYAARWVVIKHDWDLATDPSERDALREMLGFCPAE